MGVLILPSRRIWKPTLGVQINWGHPLARGLAGCYLFNEQGGLIAHNRIPSMHGALQGATSWLANRSINFTGAVGCRIQIPYSNTALDTTSQLSILTRVITTSAAAFQAAIARTVTNVGAPNYGNNWRLGTQSGLATWEVFPTGGNAGVASADVINDGKEHTVLGTCDLSSTSGKLFVDGVKTTSFACSGSFRTNSQPIYIGCLVSTDLGEGYRWVGQIFYVCIWKANLTAEDALWLYAEPYCFLQPVIRRFYSIPEEIKVMNRIYRPVKQQSPTIPVRQLGI